MASGLGSRLTECTRLVNLAQGRSIREIFGDIDSLKFRSSMTLFAQVAGDNAVFTAALDKYFGGQPDKLTAHRRSSSLFSVPDVTSSG